MKILCKILPILLLVIACNNTPKDDGTVPPPLFPQPQRIVANPEGGYQINPVTGDSIKPLINSLGDTIKTGVPIPAKPKFIHPDSVAKPKVVKAPDLESLEKHDAHPNRHKIPDDIPTITVDHSQLKTVKFGEGDQDFVLVNSEGDTIPTGVPIPAKGKVVKAVQPKPVKALPPESKEDVVTHIQHLNWKHGINAHYFYSIKEDSKGNIWFGTMGGGVIRYNGQNFIHYGEKEGLTNKPIMAIVEGDKDDLWFASHAGIICYDGKSFTHFNEKNGLGNNKFSSGLADSKGNMWFGSSGGVVRYDGKSFSIITQKEGLNHNKISSIIEDKNGKIWFGSSGGGVSFYDGKSFTHLTQKEGLSRNFVTSMIEDRNGVIWIGTFGGGISRYDGNDFQLFNWKEGLSSGRISSMSEDVKGNVWIGTFGSGVNYYDGKSFTHFTENEGLGHNSVSSILEDSKRGIWIGTSGGGVNILNEKNLSRFTLKETLVNKKVISALSDNKGGAWFGTFFNGVIYSNGESFSFITKKNGLSNDKINSILEVRNGNIWFGTDEGVTLYNGEIFTHFTEKEGLSNNKINSILEDKKGNVWFGTNGGVTLYDGKVFSHFTEKEGLISNAINSIFEDNKGNVWFGTVNGVTRYNGKIFTHYTEKEGLSDNHIGAIIEDQSGNLWLGYWGGGITKYNEEGFTHFTKKEGLNNTLINSILEDQNGNLWFGTWGGGILHYNGDSFVSITEEDGLSNNWVHAITQDKNNRIWTATEKGITALSNTFSKQPPKAYLRTIDINEQFIDYHNISDTLIDEIEVSGAERFENYPLNLALPYEKNHLTFHFVGIDWSAPHKIQYSHRLLGLNSKWSTPSHETKVDYRGLPYSNYTFQLRAIGESGEWSEPFEYTFTIHPPWWHTWRARMFYVLFALTLILALFKWRTNKLKKRQIELETEVDNATKEIREQKEVVEKQKEVVEKQKSVVESAHEELQEKNKEILDSINYAKRLQDAILPPVKLVKEYFNESFILFKPKDIVSGDFYWMETSSLPYSSEDTVNTPRNRQESSGNKLIMFAAADCTGHGVPGAMVSVVCANALYKSVNELHLTDPGRILDATRTIVIDTFSKQGGDVKDGMDISLCVLDEVTQTLYWAGANNPLWILRASNNEIEEVKANKQPIGLYGELLPFKTHSIDIQEGDCIYLFSDGYADQFGGEKGKKFKAGRFKKLLFEIKSLSMDQQKAKLDEAFEQWKGQIEQIDDVCVIGVKLNPKPQSPFTKRELEVIRLLAQGLSSKLIADKLNLSKDTVDTHRRKMLKKAEAYNTTELLNYCKEIGVI